MTVYNPANHRAPFLVGTVLETVHQADKIARDLAAAGLIVMIRQTTSPANVNVIWLNQGAGVQALPGVINAHDGTAWVLLTPLLLLRHLAGSTTDTATMRGSLSVGNRIGINTAVPSFSIDMRDVSDALAFPVGTTAQRPALAAGLWRWNTTLTDFEMCDGVSWTQLRAPQGVGSWF